MSKKILNGFGLCLVVSLVLVLASANITQAASTTKQLSTNYTLVNLGAQDAHVVVQYLLDSGATWTAPAGSTNFTITANGGQKIVRQYQDAMTPTSGRGSAVVSSDQPLGAVVQILAVGQTASSGAYSGFTAVSDKFYVPLVARRLSSASGTVNSQVMIQNTGGSATTVSVQFIGAASYTKSGISIPAGATYYYDLDDETNLVAPWYGSAVVQAASGGTVAVVSNLFTGPNGMQTYNAFPASSVGPKWLVPLFTARLANGLSAPIAVQNLSGAPIAVNGITLSCTPDAGATGFSALTVKNSTAVADNASYYFNPVTDSTNFPTGWYGSCMVDAGSSNVVAFVQMRTVGTDNAGAYEAINASGTNTKAFVPLVAKRLGNGFASAVTIQNLSSTTDANVTLTYTPSPDYVAAGGSATALTTSTTIPKSASLIQNQRLTTFAVGATAMPSGWFGTLTVQSTNSVAIDGFVQLTNVNNPAGDTFMAHGVFTQP